MLYLNKRGQAKFLVTIMIVIIGFIVVFAVVRMFASKAEGTQLEMQCRASVLVRVKTRPTIELGWAKFISPVFLLGTPKVVGPQTPLLCFTQEKKLSGNAYEVMDKMARLMARCVWMFGNGKYFNVFDGSEGEHCFICYVAKVDGLSEKVNAGDFLYFLHQKKYMNEIQKYTQLVKVNLQFDAIEDKHIYFVVYKDYSPGKVYMTLSDEQESALKNRAALSQVVVTPDIALAGCDYVEES